MDGRVILSLYLRMATPVSNAVALTGDTSINLLSQGSEWLLAPDRVITYSLDQAFDNESGTGTWDSIWINRVAAAFAAWEAVANVHFVLMGTPNAQARM